MCARIASWSIMYQAHIDMHALHIGLASDHHAHFPIHLQFIIQHNL